MNDEIYLFRDGKTGENRRLNRVQKILWQDPTRNKVIVFHRRAGKTSYCVARNLVSILQNERHRYWYVGPTYRQAKTIVWDMAMYMVEQFPLGTFSVNRVELSIECNATKAKFELKGSDNPDSLRGGGLNGLTLDEFQDQDPSVYSTVCRPMLATTGGWCDMIGTPKGKNHFYDYYLTGAGENVKWKSFLIKASESGIIPQEELNDMKAEMSEEEYNQEMECDFLSYAGLIYKEFGRHNLIEPFEIPNEWEHGYSLDHGATNPTSVHHHRIDFEGNIYIVDEYYEPNKLISEHAPKILTMLHSEDSEIIGDPSIFNKNMQSRSKDYKYSVADEYQDYGITGLVPGNNDVTAGINRMREYIKLNPKRVNPITGERGAPKLFIFKGKNPKLEWEIANYSWKKKSSLSTNEPDIPLKVNDHACDEVRYFVMSRPDTPEQKKPVQMKTASVVLGRVQEKLRNINHSGPAVPSEIRESIINGDADEDSDDPIRDALDDLDFS